MHSRTGQGRRSPFAAISTVLALAATTAIVLAPRAAAVPGPDPFGAPSPAPHRGLLTPGPEACPTQAGGLPLSTATIPEIRSAFDGGSLTSRELVSAYLARIEALNRRGPQLKAVITTAPDALAQADAADAARAAGQDDGPLAGIPVLLKDNIDTFDFDTTAGAKAMLGAPPPADAFLAARLRAAGAIVLGKANMDEWATRLTEEQPHGFSDVGGQGRNPYTLGDPSGSSGGSAISSASGLAASTVGTETSGSIIDPSWVNSAAGIKPTRGLVSRGGVIPLLSEYDTPGPIDQNLTDAAVMLGTMTGVDPRDPVTAKQVGHTHGDYTQFLDPNALRGARIGLPELPKSTRLFGIPQLQRIRSELEAQGATVVELEDNLLRGSVDPNAFQARFRAELNRYLEARGPTSPMGSMAEIVEFNRRGGRDAVRYGQKFLVDAERLPAEERQRARRAVRETIREVRGPLQDTYRDNDLDALLISRAVSALTNTGAGFPAVTVPVAYPDDRPVGAILAGPRWSEAELIGFGYDLEQAIDGWRSPAEINPEFAAACAS